MLTFKKLFATYIKMQCSMVAKYESLNLEVILIHSTLYAGGPGLELQFGVVF